MVSHIRVYTYKTGRFLFSFPDLPSCFHAVGYDGNLDGWMARLEKQRYVDLSGQYRIFLCDGEMITPARATKPQVGYFWTEAQLRSAVEAGEQAVVSPIGAYHVRVTKHYLRLRFGGNLLPYDSIVVRICDHRGVWSKPRSWPGTEKVVKVAMPGRLPSVVDWVFEGMAYSPKYREAVALSDTPPDAVITMGDHEIHVHRAVINLYSNKLPYRVSQKEAPLMVSCLRFMYNGDLDLCRDYKFYTDLVFAASRWGVMDFVPVLAWFIQDTINQQPMVCMAVILRRASF